MDPNGAIEIVYPNNNNNNNNNNNIIIIIKWKKNQMGQGASSGGEERARERDFIFYFPSLCFLFRSMEIGSRVFVGAESKVDIHDESYAWTPKSWSFVKLHEVGNFPTCVISSLKAI